MTTTKRSGNYMRTPIMDQINRTADDPSVSIAVPVAVAENLIELAGGERVTDGPGQWVFPDEFWTWETDEALRYALEVLPDICEA